MNLNEWIWWCPGRDKGMIRLIRVMNIMMQVNYSLVKVAAKSVIRVIWFWKVPGTDEKSWTQATAGNGTWDIMGHLCLSFSRCLRLHEAIQRRRAVCHTMRCLFSHVQTVQHVMSTARKKLLDFFASADFGVWSKSFSGSASNPKALQFSDAEEFFSNVRSSNGTRTHIFIYST